MSQVPSYSGPPPSYQESQGSTTPAGYGSAGYGTVPTSSYPQSTWGANQQIGSTTVTVQSQPQVVVVGGCPACRVGVLEDDFTCLGICCAMLFFPIGILCCLAMRQRRCPNCGAIFG